MATREVAPFGVPLRSRLQDCALTAGRLFLRWLKVVDGSEDSKSKQQRRLSVGAAVSDKRDAGFSVFLLPANLVTLASQLWAPGRTPVAPRHLARFAPQLSGYNQDDSQLWKEKCILQCDVHVPLKLPQRP